MSMNTTESAITEIKSEAPKSGATSRPEREGGSIRYCGVKEPRVPVPIVLLVLLLLAAVAVAVLHYSRI
jgi:hypothetical protein